MSFQMSPKNPRKRAAPGATSVESSIDIQATFASPQSVTDRDFLKWPQNSEDTSYSNSSVRSNLNTFGSEITTQNGFHNLTSSQSTQLARRPLNHHHHHNDQQVMQTGLGSYEGIDSLKLLKEEPPVLELPINLEMEEENQSIEALEEKAATAKRDAQAKRKQIPPFVQKLSSFLEESRNTDLIRWSERGDSFVVLDEDEFAKTLIPELFKHNNYASFVRQLNMYGFHKRVGLSDNSMKASERKNKSPSEYYNPYFKRGHQNLLWLINKPKGSSSKNKKKLKGLESFLIDSDEEKDVEEIFGNATQNTRAISAGPESNSLQRRDINVLNQLAEIQQQQIAISSAIQRLRKDHNTLYQQSIAFQSLHDRHESSISAILTFLATVYNRSLDGQNPPNFAQMFSNSIPHNDQQHPGSVMDIGDVPNSQDQNLGSMSPRKKAQRLLMAPPNSKKGAGTARPSTPISTKLSTKTETSTTYESKSTNILEENFEKTFCGQPVPGSPPSPLHSPTSTVQQSNMMSIINNANAANSDSPTKAMEFPEVLSHYENSNGNSPLTSEQRNTMLSLIASSSDSGTNNALVSPTPPAPLPMEEIKYTNNEIDDLLRLHIEQDAKIGDVKSILTPLSPTNFETNPQECDFFNNEVPNNNLDLDQFLDTGAYFTGNSNQYDYEIFGDDNSFCMDIDSSVGVKVEATEKMVVDLASKNQAAFEDEKPCKNIVSN